MKHKSLIWSLIIFLLTLNFISCEKDSTDIEPEALEEEEVAVITDPFYANLKEDSSLEDYWKLFVADAIRSGKADPGAGRIVNVFFGNEPDFASGVTSDHAGRAYNICDAGTVSFEIIESFWEDFLKKDIYKSWNIKIWKQAIKNIIEKLNHIVYHILLIMTQAII